MLRDPAARVVSALRHDRTQRISTHLRVKGALRSGIRHGNLTIQEYIDGPVRYVWFILGSNRISLRALLYPPFSVGPPSATHLHPREHIRPGACSNWCNWHLADVHSLWLFRYLPLPLSFSPPLSPPCAPRFIRWRLQTADKHLNHAVAMLSGAGAGTTDPRHLVTAKRVLIEMDFMVGVFERYAESIVLWQHELGLSVPQVLSCTNTNAKIGSGGGGGGEQPAAVDAVTGAQLTSLRTQHSLDTALLGFARERFEQRWRQQLGMSSLSDPAATLTCAANPEGCLSTHTQLSVAPTATGSGLDEVVCWRRCSVNGLEEGV